MRCVNLEQAVYGSFPFWDRGYAVLARSPGCRPEWVEEFVSACSRLGERPRDVCPADSLFALRLSSGPWMIVGARDQGADDQGRPGALAFHALFVSNADYRLFGSSPFAFAHRHRGDWTADTSLTLLSEPLFPRRIGEAPTDSPNSKMIARALSRNRRVAIVTDHPIDGLARDVWGHLSPRQRARKALATWAFGVENGFDLVGLPARPNLVIPDGYINGSDLTGPSCSSKSSRISIPGPREDDQLQASGASSWPSSRPKRLPRAAVLFAAALGLSAVAGAWFSRSDHRIHTPAIINLRPLPQPLPPPERAAEISPETRQIIGSKLRDMSRRFGIEASGSWDDPAFRMRRMASSLRYRGPLLSPADLIQLRGEREAGRARALDWDEQIRHFVPDRPLPEDFEDQPLTRQLSTFAWSFHLALDPHLIPAEIPEAIGYALAVDGPTRSNPLSNRYPALRDYARFLDRLPRR